LDNVKYFRSDSPQGFKYESKEKDLIHYQADFQTWSNQITSITKSPGCKEHPSHTGLCNF